MKVVKLKDVLSAIDLVESSCDGYFDAPYWYERICYDLRYRIEDLETFNYKRRKRGKWIDHMGRDWRCSLCGARIDKVRHVDGYCYDDLPNYCPDCGAKMTGKRKK